MPPLVVALDGRYEEGKIKDIDLFLGYSIHFWNHEEEMFGREIKGTSPV